MKLQKQIVTNMHRTIIFIIVMMASTLCGLDTYAQGKVTRPAKQQSQITQLNKPKVTVSDPDGYINGHGYIDLGLPSGTKWATCNIGASSPSKFGDYFAWGGIKNRTPSNLYDVFVESIALNPLYDAATFNWGVDWQLPSRNDFQELIDNCKTETVNFNGRNGKLFIGPNGKKLYFPYAGIIHTDGYNGGPAAGFYWNSAIPPQNAGASGYVCGEAFLISKKDCISGMYYSRKNYCPIRPISR